MRHAPTPRSLTISATLTVAALLAASGCSGTGDSDDATTTTISATTTTAATTSTTTAPESTEPDGFSRRRFCPSSDELADLLGGDLDRSSTSGLSSSFNLSGASFSYNYRGCDYDLEGDLDGSVSVTRITSDDVQGPLFDALLEEARSDFTENGFTLVPEFGAEAYRDADRIVVHLDGLIVFVESSLDDEADMDAALLLANALTGVDPAMLSNGGRDDDRPTPVCDDLRAPVQAALGTVVGTGVYGWTSAINQISINADGCTFEHQDGHESKISVGDDVDWQAWVQAKLTSPLTSRLDEARLAGLPAFDDGEVLVVDDADPQGPMRIGARGDDLPTSPARLRRSIAELMVER